ncbi:MAG: hypothetical protein QM770_16820 [Tepidisphaeraceae bacterium]
MKKSLLTSALALAAFAVPSASFAAEEAAKPNTGALTFGLDTTLTTAYFFRGYNQEDGGIILQPNVNVSFLAVDTDDVDVSLKVGSWNSFHSQRTAGTGMWYESDLYAIATVALSNGLSFNVGYTDYTYPDPSFKSIQELGISTVYDYTKLLPESVKGLGGTVSLATYKEIDDGNGSEDWYWEVGVNPSYSVDVDVPGMGKPTLTFPITLGGSFDGYYAKSDGSNNVLGYLDVGVAAACPLGVPSKYGTWTLTVRGDWLHLFADSAEFANNGEDNQFIGSVNVALSY